MKCVRGIRARLTDPLIAGDFSIAQENMSIWYPNVQMKMFFVYLLKSLILLQKYKLECLLLRINDL